MRKLLKLKEWVSVADAAKRLSLSIGEVVTEADILRLGLDGHLTLSVNFVNYAKGRAFRIEPYSRKNDVPDVVKSFAEMTNQPDRQHELNEFFLKYRGELLNDGEDVIIHEGDMQSPIRLLGIWDLTMLGAEALDVEHAYQRLTGGPAVELVCLEGPLVVSADKTKYFQLLDSYTHRPCQTVNITPREKPEISKKTRQALDRLNKITGPVTTVEQKKEEFSEMDWDYETIYHPAAGLRGDSPLVVRVAALLSFEDRLLAGDPETEKPLHPAERRSVGQIIAALAAMGGLDICSPYSAAEVLRAAAATNGLEMPSSDETIVKFLKMAATKPIDK